MIFPNSLKKWLTISMAALVLSASSGAYTGSVAVAVSIAAEPLTLEKAIAETLAKNSELAAMRLAVKNADTHARLVRDHASELRADAIEGLKEAESKYASPAEAEMNKAINTLALKRAENQTKLGAQKVYYELLHAQAEVELKKQSHKRAEAQAKAVKAGFDVGTRAKTDILQAEVSLSGAEAALVNAENSLLNAKMKVNQFLGVDLQKEWAVKSDNKQVKPLDMNLDEAVHTALRQLSEIAQRQEELRLAELKEKLIAEYSALSTYQGKMASYAIENAKVNMESQKREIVVEVSQAYNNLHSAKLAV